MTTSSPGLPYLLLLGGAGALLLPLLIARLVRLIRASVVARLPLAAEQPLDLDAGRTQVFIEIPRRRGVRRRALVYRFVDRESGAEVPFAPTLVRSRIGGRRAVRLLEGSVRAPRACAATLFVDGAREAMDGCHVVFSRPVIGPMVLYIVGITLCGLAVIGAAVVALVGAIQG